MVNISIDVTDLGGEARPGDKVVLWKPAAAGSATHAGRVISTAPVDVFLTSGKATVPDVEPGSMRVLLQCRGVESQGPIDVTVPDGTGTVTLRSLIEAQFEYAPPIVSAVQEAADNAAASERAAIQAQVRSEAASQSAAQSETSTMAFQAAAASAAFSAKTSETNAKQSETNAGEHATAATTAAAEAVDAMESANTAVDSIAGSVSEAAGHADRAEQYETSAATHAQNASDAADRVGTAEQVGTWASEASSSASSAAAARDDAVAARGAAQSASNAAKDSETAAAGSAAAAKDSETNAAQSSSSANTHRADAASQAAAAAQDATRAESARDAAQAAQSAAKDSETNADAHRQAAATSETNAAAHESSAGLSAEASADSAIEAKGHADRAEQMADPDGLRNEITQQLADLVDGAPEDLDTIREVAEYAQANRDITDQLNAAIGNKANKSHAHAIGEVTGLNDALNGKADKSHTHAWSSITGRPDIPVTDVGYRIRWADHAPDLYPAGVSVSMSATEQGWGAALAAGNPDYVDDGFVVILTIRNGRYDQSAIQMAFSYTNVTRPVYVRKYNGEAAGWSNFRKLSDDGHKHNIADINGGASKGYVDSRPALFSGVGAPPASIPGATVGDWWLDTSTMELHKITGV